MAWSAAAVSADDLAHRLQNRPILGGAHALENATNIKWRTSGSYAAGVDDNDLFYPPARAVDRGADARTRPATAAATHYLLFDCSAAPVAFDVIALIGHNWNTVGATVQVQIADNNAFSVNLATLATYAPSNSKRQVTNFIDHTISPAVTSYAYSGVPYVRLRFTAGGAVKAEIGESWLFSRRQLPQNPQHPWDPSHRGQSEVAQFITEGGAVHTYAKHSGRADCDLTMKFGNSTDAAVLQGFISDCSHGAKPGIIIPRPYTTGTDARIVSVGPGGFATPTTRPTSVREYRVGLRECAPFVSSEGI